MANSKSAYSFAGKKQKSDTHIIVVWVDNEAGVLARVVGLFSGRGYNIESFAEDKRPVYDAPHVINKQIEVKDGQVLDLNFQMPVQDVKVNQVKMSREVAGH